MIYRYNRISQLLQKCFLFIFSLVDVQEVNQKFDRSALFGEILMLGKKKALFDVAKNDLNKDCENDDHQSSRDKDICGLHHLTGDTIITDGIGHFFSILTNVDILTILPYIFYQVTILTISTILVLHTC